MGSKYSLENEDLIEIVSDDESEEIIDPVTIKSVSEALQIVDLVMRFSQQYAEYTDDQQMTAKNNRLFLQMSFVFM